MLNAYFEVAVPPVVRRHGGDVDRIIGDALMVTFNKRGDQPDHAQRAAAAGLALQRERQGCAASTPAGRCSGSASTPVPCRSACSEPKAVGPHTVIGDTVNVASRIEGKAPAGGRRDRTADEGGASSAVTESLGLLDLKGKAEPLEVHRLVSLDVEGADER